jgi:hypothetical protein
MTTVSHFSSGSCWEGSAEYAGFSNARGKYRQSFRAGATVVAIESWPRGGVATIKQQRAPDAEGWWEQRAPSLSFHRRGADPCLARAAAGETMAPPLCNRDCSELTHRRRLANQHRRQLQTPSPAPSRPSTPRILILTLTHPTNTPLWIASAECSPPRRAWAAGPHKTPT